MGAACLLREKLRLGIRIIWTRPHVLVDRLTTNHSVHVGTHINERSARCGAEGKDIASPADINALERPRILPACGNVRKRCKVEHAREIATVVGRERGWIRDVPLRGA